MEARKSLLPMSMLFQCFSIGSWREMCSTLQIIPSSPNPPFSFFSWLVALLFNVVVALYSLDWVCMGPHISPPSITSSSLSSRSPSLSFSHVTDMFGGKKSVIWQPRVTVLSSGETELITSDTLGLFRKPVNIRGNTLVICRWHQHHLKVEAWVYTFHIWFCNLHIFGICPTHPWSLGWWAASVQCGERWPTPLSSPFQVHSWAVCTGWRLRRSPRSWA